MTHTRKISLGKRGYALVDTRDYKKLIKHKWHINKNGYVFYVARNIYIGDGKRSKILMHRVILGLKKGEMTDHINGDGLDNRRCNLRKCSYIENVRNQRLGKNNTSGYRGICCQKKGRGGWEVRIKVNRKVIYLGLYKDKIEAAKVYDVAAKKYYGKYAKLNFGKGSTNARYIP